MQLFVALTPPDHVIDDVESALARVPAPPGELDLVPRSALLIPVFGLGNITRVEATSLGHFLRDELVSAEPAPRVRFSGVWALEEEGDPTLALPLVGEVDRVKDLTNRLPVLVAEHGFFVDRRRFVTRMTIGSVTPSTSLKYLEKIVRELEQHASPVWSLSRVSLVRPRWDSDAQVTEWEVVEHVSTVPDLA